VSDAFVIDDEAAICKFVTLALANLGLIDEYTFVVQPVLAGHGPTLLAGLREQVELELVERQEFRSGVTALRFRPRAA
jgi:dihydrofolate reductase